MERLVCPDCFEQIKISQGNISFSYDIKCDNGHHYENVYLDDLLKNKNFIENNYFCHIHNKKNIIICSDCDKCICSYCFQNDHRTHKINYSKPLSNYEKDNFINEKTNYQKTMNKFLKELKNFKEELNINIENLQSLVEKNLTFRNKLFNNVLENKNYSYIDYTNLINNFKENEINQKINNYIKEFINCQNFLEKVNIMGKFFENIIGNKYNIMINTLI